MTDHFLYNGEIVRKNDLAFIDLVNEQKTSDSCALYLVTPGGDPDAAYKIGRYLQDQYESFTVVVSGFCKSAGTLLAIAANELAFTPYGELGPLDVQITKADQFSLESGLNISEAFGALEDRARDAFSRTVFELIGGSGGVLSFPTAAHAAAEVISGLYGPVFGGIDPEEVGSRSRAMRIGEHYGLRLNLKAKNLKNGALERISQSYASHSFVIDHNECMSLFNNVRAASQVECAIVEQLGASARFPGRQFDIRKLDVPEIQMENEDDQSGQDFANDGDGGVEKPDASRADAAKRGKRSVGGPNGADSSPSGGA